jgi:hypothetical protein
MKYLKLLQESMINIRKMHYNEPEIMLLIKLHNKEAKQPQPNVVLYQLLNAWPVPKE